MFHVSDKDLSPVPVTSSLVKVSSLIELEWMGYFTYAHTNTQVLKYSDEDLMKLVQLARRRANQRERQKVEEYTCNTSKFSYSTSRGAHFACPCCT